MRAGKTSSMKPCFMHGFESYVTLAEALDAKITDE